jgi:hypothetical protein
LRYTCEEKNIEDAGPNSPFPISVFLEIYFNKKIYHISIGDCL